MKRMDSKQGFIAASDVHVHLQCAMLISHDQGFTAVAYVNSGTKISCHSKDQPTFDGGVTVARQSFRKRASAQSCFLYRVRWPPPKQITFDTQPFKYFNPTSLMFNFESRKHGTRAPHRATFFASISELPRKPCIAKHFQFRVPRLLWASSGTICWTWLPRKSPPYLAFGFLLRNVMVSAPVMISSTFSEKCL